jgi:hypothetical protein
VHKNKDEAPKSPRAQELAQATPINANDEETKGEPAPKTERELNAEKILAFKRQQQMREQQLREQQQQQTI